MCCNDDILWTGFGYGDADIFISNKCNENRDSYSSLGCDYDAPQGYAYGSEEAKSYLAGSHKFKVTEIEVYKINFN